ncbi:PAC2 family protein [Dehalogenimonas sp. THU2]|uniref:PAC2 family protein n=1 Tax=Dehalogenimonas sp. THU2 TaxID=3151121 RepID=UPI003218615F
MTGRLSYLASPRLEIPVMVVGWESDAGNLGGRVSGYLTETLGLKPLAAIDPVGYFPLSSVDISADLVGFPSSLFYYSEEANLIVFKSDVPVFETHEFLRLVLDLAVHYNAGYLVLVNGLPSMASHNTPSEILANMNFIQLKEWLNGDGINTGINYESPPGQKPPISTYLIWEARSRDIMSVSLWLPVPFYLSALTDEIGARRLLAFLKEKFIPTLDLEIAIESEGRLRGKLGDLRSGSKDCDKYLSMLESNLSLTEYEAGQLAAEVRRTFHMD